MVSGSPASLRVTFYRNAMPIATQVINNTRVNGTGNNTMVAGVHTGEPLTITYSNNGTQTATASIKHEASKAQTYIVYISQISTAAVGTSTGGPGK